MRKSLFLAAVAFLLIPLAGLGAWDTRLLGLDTPALNLTGAVPTAYPNVIFPTDEFGIGLSAVPDTLDVFFLPQQIVNEKLFPSNSVILDWTGAGGNGGMVFGLGNGLAGGLFLLRPGANGWVTGTPRSEFAGLGGSFFADAGLAVTAPTAPSNLVDFIIAMKAGSILVGAGLGFSYSQAASDTTSDVGVTDSATTDTSASWVATGRVGASLPLGPLSLDLGGLVLLGNAKASVVSGSAAPVPDLNEVLNAFNISMSINARGIMALSSTLDLVLLGELALLPQNYSASTAAGALTTTTILVDPSGYTSIGAGGGVNWKPADNALVNLLLTGVYGSGTWVDVAPGATPRTETSVGWIALRPVLDGEFRLTSWFTVRGGVSGFVRWWGEAFTPGTGTATATMAAEIGMSASAGLGFRFTEKSSLDLVVNLTNWSDQLGIGMRTPALRTSFKIDL